MSNLKELMRQIPQVGTVEWISVRPERRGAITPLDEVEITVEGGLAGDH